MPRFGRPFFCTLTLLSIGAAVLAAFRTTAGEPAHEENLGRLKAVAAKSQTDEKDAKRYVRVKYDDRGNPLRAGDVDCSAGSPRQ